MLYLGGPVSGTVCFERYWSRKGKKDVSASSPPGSTSTEARLLRLKEILQRQTNAGTFERLTAALFSRLTGITVAVAKSGFQFGGDASTAGRQGRHLRIETKRYLDTTTLSDRELLGEIDHAVDHDPALEAWILAATREVSDQLEQALMIKAAETGVPVVIVDWKADGFPSLAALCTIAPEMLEALISSEAKDLASALAGDAVSALERLKRDVETWQLGFETVRAAAQRRIASVWMSPRASLGYFGQDAAGGSRASTIRRQESFDALETWWTSTDAPLAPATVLGQEGMGKTWATLDWLVAVAEKLPIALVLPSTAMAGFASVTTVSLKRMLADHLHEITQVRDPDHWLKRVDRLLKRPPEEGASFLVFFDGMNQEPETPWIQTLSTLQTDAFAPMIRVIVSTRSFHFEQRLNSLSRLIARPKIVRVDRYSPEELDERLAREGLTRADLHADLVPFAEVPRLFGLVVRFRERLVESGSITVHRLLWEYGRDTFGDRPGGSFTEQDWRAWLHSVAQQAREGIVKVSLQKLSASTARPDLTETDVYRRLCDIVDSDFASSTPTGDIRLSPVLVEHALGAALLAELDALAEPTTEAAEALLAQWGDPIFGLDEVGEIRRAAVSIMIERRVETPREVAAALLADWLQTQNLPERHRRELCSLAPRLLGPLLDVLPRHANVSRRSVTTMTVRAIRAIPRSDATAAREIIEACVHWLRQISRDIAPPERRQPEAEESRSKRIIQRIGTDKDGPLRLLGVPVEIHGYLSGGPRSLVPALLDGFPLASATPIFEALAISHAVMERTEPWRGMKWLCRLNMVDFANTTAALVSLSEDILKRPLEPGVSSDFRTRVAALLLWMTCDDEFDPKAAGMRTPIYEMLSYEQYYLSNPSNGFMRLEHRHAGQVLEDTMLTPIARVRRLGDHWPDTQLDVPARFKAELVAASAYIDVTTYNASAFSGIADHDYEILEPALARCDPQALARLVRRKLTETAGRDGESRYFFAINTVDHLLLANDDIARAAQALRVRGPDEYAEGDDYSETFARNMLLMFEIADQAPRDQVIAIVNADLRSIFNVLYEGVGPLDSADVDELLDHFRPASSKQSRDLLVAVSDVATGFSERAWDWLIEHAFDASFEPEHDFRGLAFRTLYRTDAVRFGKFLRDRDWRWDPKGNLHCNHFGSLAIAIATAGLPLEQSIGAIAPWLVLHALTLRPTSTDDVRLAVTVVSGVLDEPQEVPEPGAHLFVYSARRAENLAAFSVVPIEERDDNNVEASLNRAFDVEKQREIRALAAETARLRIAAARAAGASLYLHDLEAEDFGPVLMSAPDVVSDWLQGLEGRTTDFKRRVRLAEGFFLALCEALLRTDPGAGLTLWQALEDVMVTTFIGEAKIRQLDLMLFRAPNHPEIDAALERRLSINRTNNDEDLFNLAIAAQLGGRRAWLDAIIAADQSSGVVWKAQRATRLGGFLTGAKAPVTQAWANGRSTSSREDRERAAADLLQRDADAHHWWDVYWSAPTAEEAYAAWVLFKACVDRRAFVWMHMPDLGTSALQRRKQLHYALNRNDLESGAEKREKKLKDHFLTYDLSKNVSPWLLPNDAPDDGF